MQELINFSNHAYDTKQFGDISVDVGRFLSKHKLNGIELLIGYDPSTIFPKDKICSVHLPFWVTWLDVWNEVPGAVKKYFNGCDEKRYKYMCGGTTKDEMVDSLSQLWKNAAQLHANYAVMHACHVELEHAFNREYTYTNIEVLTAFSELLNKTAQQFPNGEPPITIALENLWWPGLTLNNHAETQAFMAMLAFNNWVFVLDTGHLLNTSLQVDNEEEGILFLNQWLKELPAVIKQKIEVIHLCFSGSKTYQTKTIKKGVPNGFSTMAFSEKHTSARNHVAQIDQHKPFSTRAIYDLVQALNPKFLVHEFLGDIENKASYLAKQKAGKY